MWGPVWNGIIGKFFSGSYEQFKGAMTIEQQRLKGVK